MPVALRPNNYQYRSFTINSASVNGTALHPVSVSLRFSLRDSHPSIVIKAFATEGQDPTDYITRTTINTAYLSLSIAGNGASYEGILDHVNYTEDNSGAKYINYVIVPRSYLFFRATSTLVFVPPGSGIATSSTVVTDPGTMSGRIKIIMDAYNDRFPDNKVESFVGDGIYGGLSVDGVRLVSMTYADMVNELISAAGYRIKLDFQNKLTIYSIINPIKTSKYISESDYTNPSINIDTMSRSA